jgi:hypothetical protein
VLFALFVQAPSPGLLLKHRVLADKPVQNGRGSGESAE